MALSRYTVLSSVSLPEDTKATADNQNINQYDHSFENGTRNCVFSLVIAMDVWEAHPRVQHMLVSSPPKMGRIAVLGNIGLTNIKHQENGSVSKHQQPN
jgi:hypothetical protein